MKAKYLLVFILAAILLSGCSGKNKIQENNISSAVQDSVSPVEKEVRYIELSADWPVYKRVDELIKAAEIVVLGKITGVSFQVLDMKTGFPPTKDSEERYCCLHAIYDVEVDTVYKGNTDGKLQFALEGGIKEKYLEEQLAAIADFGEEEIPVMAGMQEINVGETYLLVLYQYENAIPTLVNPKQGVYQIDDPLQKDAYSYVSPKEIISYFGEDKWTAFISQEDAGE